MNPVSKLWARWGNSVRELLKFAIVGGMGVGVNMLTVAVAHSVGFHAFGVEDYDPFIPLLGTDRALRFYIVYAGIAFLVANLFNFVWNRYWTFRHQGSRAPFGKEFLPFLIVGGAAQLVGFVILYLLRNPTSPFYLGHEFFTDAGAWWTKRLYWAQLIQIILVMPINFVANKLWTFRAVRRRHAASTTVGEPGGS